MRKAMTLFMAFLAMLVLPFAALAQDAETPVEGMAVEEALTFADTGEDLAAGYISSHLNPLSSRAADLQGDGLTGTARNLYDALKECIAEVAAGTRESTVFTFSAADIFAKTYYTREELGVETVVSGGAFTQEARSAVSTLISSECALRTVMNALMADSPYEMYWFDKTAGMKRKGPSYSGTSKGITLKGEVTITMAVSEEYAAGDNLVKSIYGLGVTASAETARVIVEAYEGESDYDRLYAYRQAIFELSSYNSAAAAGGAAYGNPWQMIWVLDGDPETTVVCEGYAKAFQYLNSLSSSAVTVISPLGYLNGAAHMWNIVRMDDGRNYLVDLTNSDAGMAGAPDGLFLVGGAFGSVSEGYTVEVKGGSLTYVYRDTGFDESQLHLAGWNYLDGKPAAPSFTLSADRGYVGYSLVARLSEPAESVLIAETGEETACGGTDIVIPLTEAGTCSVSLAVMQDGVYSDFSDPVTVEVACAETDALYIPYGTEAIESEAFRGTAAVCVLLPDTVVSIGDAAFADCASLRMADCGSAVFTGAAFEGCTDLVLCLSDADAGFAMGIPFLLR